jgi:hypothetical protein
MMEYSSVRNPVWADAAKTIINCEVDFVDLVEDFVPFTSAQGAEGYTGQIYAQCAVGDFGPVADFVPPPPPDYDALRHNAYVAESDPIFFMSQRGEATEQQWLDKVAEIKARWPA